MMDHRADQAVVLPLNRRLAAKRTGLRDAPPAGQGSGGGLVARADLHRLRAHPVGFTFQTLVVIQGDAGRHLEGWPDTALRLLHHMPRLVRQVLFLPRTEMDIAPLGEGVRLQLRGPG